MYCFPLKKEQKEANNKEKNNSKNTKTALNHEVAILASKDEECLKGAPLLSSC